MRLFILFASIILNVLSAQAQSAPEAAYARIVSGVIRPGFAGLAAEARRHEDAWTGYCRSPSPAGLARLASSFQALADSWARVDMIRSGPAAGDFRHERFSFWPERKNAVERGLAALLKRPGAASLTPADIRKETAAAQGLPALERLIQPDGLPDARLGIGPDGELRCHMGEIISGNAAGLAAEMEAAWRPPAGSPTPEARAMLATDIVTAYAILKDTKIETVIGKDATGVKPRAAEFWRSGRPIRNIVINLEVLDRINALLFPEASDEVVLPFATQTALKIAASIPDLAQVASGDKRSEAVLLRDAIGAAGERAMAEVPPALGVTIGFNSLDGD